MLHKWLSARDSASKLFVRGGKSYFRRGVEGKFDVFKGKFYPAFFLQLLYKLGILFTVIFLIFSRMEN